MAELSRVEQSFKAPLANQLCIPIFNGWDEHKFFHHTRVTIKDGTLHVKHNRMPLEGWPEFMEGAREYGHDEWMRIRPFFLLGITKPLPEHIVKELLDGEETP